MNNLWINLSLRGGRQPDVVISSRMALLSSDEERRLLRPYRARNDKYQPCGAVTGRATLPGKV